MNPRILLLAALAASALLPATAEARQKTGAHFSPPMIDVAAIPAYPLEQARGRLRAASRAHSRKTAAPKTAASSSPVATAHPRAANGGSGVVRSAKTGATASVSLKFAAIAQAVVDDLEASGATIRFMGGYRKGKCWSGGLHPCGLAIDLCQTARGVVDRRCNLPSRAVEIKVAERHGAVSGGIWCSQDRGHIQLGLSASACGSNLYSAVRKFKAERVHQARLVHHHTRYAASRR